MSLGHVRPSVLIMSVLAGALSLSACQQKPDPDANLDDGINAEETVPMSAEPADPNITVLATEDAALNEAALEEAADDMGANAGSVFTEMTYLCSPELKVDATYEGNEVVIGTDRGTLTLTQTNEGTNPEVYEVATAIDGSEGFMQWRVANKDRATAVLRMAGADASKVSTYDCKKTK